MRHLFCLVVLRVRRLCLRVGQALRSIFSFLSSLQCLSSTFVSISCLLLPVTLICALPSILLCNSILLQINVMLVVDFEPSEFHSPIDSRCGDVLSFVFSPLLLFLHAGAVVTGLICEFSEGACLLAC